MTTFSTSVNLSPKTVEILRTQGYSLYAFKAVAGSGAGAAPTVWFRLEDDNLLTKTKITWTEDFGAYNSTTQIEPNTTIVSHNSMDTELGNRVMIDRNGNLSQSREGISGAIRTFLGSGR